MFINNRYQKPGEDILAVRCGTKNPDNDEVEINAIIENYDQSMVDTVLMFDDGAHYDSTAGDGIFGGFWSVPSGERWYNVSIKTLSINSGYYNILSNEVHFTTIGPVALEHYEIISEDTVVNPDDYLGFEFTLQNHGITDTVYNVSTKTRNLDTCAQIIAFSDPVYGDIAPGEISVSSQPISIRFDPDCPAPSKMSFVLDIYSDDYFLWSDTFFVDVISGIAREKFDMPKQFALYQNYPNPFNPKTVISWHLAVNSDVELSIYDITGRKVTRLVSEKQSAGNHQIEWDASNFASGIYFYILIARSNSQSFVRTRKLILLK